MKPSLQAKANRRDPQLRTVSRRSPPHCNKPSSAAGDSTSGKVFEALFSSLQQALLQQQGIRSAERFFQALFSSLQGFSKASLPLFKPSSQGPCKASARDPSLCSNLLVKGYAREGFNKRSFIIQSIRHGTGNQQICTPHLLI